MVHDGTRVEVPTARQREVPRQLRKLVSGAREYVALLPLLVGTAHHLGLVEHYHETSAAIYYITCS